MGMPLQEHHFYVAVTVVCVIFIICFAVYSSRGGLTMPSSSGRGRTGLATVNAMCLPTGTNFGTIDFEYLSRAGAIPNTSPVRVTVAPGVDLATCGDGLIVALPIANTVGIHDNMVAFEVDASAPPVHFFSVAADNTVKFTPSKSVGVAVVTFDLLTGEVLETGHTSGSWETVA